MPNLRTTPAADISREFQTGLPPDVRTRPYISFDPINYSNSSMLLPNAHQDFELYAPPGYIYELENIYLNVSPPSGATSGYHSFEVTGLGSIKTTYGSATYTGILKFAYSYWMYANKESHPTERQLSAIRSCVSDENNPIRVRYSNYTDANQDNTRTAQFLVRRVKV